METLQKPRKSLASNFGLGPVASNLLWDRKWERSMETLQIPRKSFVQLWFWASRGEPFEPAGLSEKVRSDWPKTKVQQKISSVFAGFLKASPTSGPKAGLPLAQGSSKAISGKAGIYIKRVLLTMQLLGKLLLSWEVC